MIKCVKLKKPKDQKDLTDLWKSNMNLSNDTSSTPEHPEMNKKKKRTLPSTECPKLKRSLLETEEELHQSPSDKAEMEIGENSEITQNGSEEPNKVGSTKVKLIPRIAGTAQVTKQRFIQEAGPKVGSSTLKCEQNQDKPNDARK